MAILKSYANLLRSSPLARTISWIIVVVSAVLILGILGRNVKRKPVIDSISPMIGSPGDEMTIEGSGFGDSRGTSSVEIAGSKITASGYSLWSDKKIKFIIPPNAQDGLVIVGTSAGKSEPAFFANENGIPVAAVAPAVTSVPVIASISAESAVTGQTIIIRGTNFGTSKGKSVLDNSSLIRGTF